MGPCSPSMPSWVLCASRRGLSFRKKLPPFRRTRRAMPELRILDLPAVPFEAGYHHGREAADLIAHNLGVYFDRFQREARLSPNEVRGRARGYLPVIEAADPAYADAMRGAAEGSRLSLDDLAVLNARYELIYSQYSAIIQENAAHAPAGGCTAFAVTPEASADGHLWLGQNWDWFPQVRGLVLRAQHPGGFTVAAFTEAGIVGGKIGMNSAGLGLVINGLLSHRDDWRRLRARMLHAQGLRSILRDHAGHPDSVCRHPNPALPEEERVETVVSVLQDLTARRMYVAGGTPCLTPYQEIEV